MKKNAKLLIQVSNGKNFKKFFQWSMCKTSAIFLVTGDSYEILQEIMKGIITKPCFGSFRSVMRYSYKLFKCFLAL